VEEPQVFFWTAAACRAATSDAVAEVAWAADPTGACPPLALPTAFCLGGFQGGGGGHVGGVGASDGGANCTRLKPEPEPVFGYAAMTVEATSTAGTAPA